ncbi:MAG: AmmeMemoRadiSam system radical SAM enzyme [Halanaerobiales bacterium]
MNTEAEYYKKINGNTIKCELCPHNCTIKKGETGLCQVRKNDNGTLYTKNYASITSAGFDPIEKKPLYHFFPGSQIFSLGSYGCNFSCKFCQNWRISQKKPSTKETLPEETVELARKKGVKSIAYTYSEPMVWFEYVKETSSLAKRYNIKNVLVTNGFINQQPLEDLLPYIDAANVDLKSFRSQFYNKYSGGSLKPVKNTIKIMAKKIHLEVTTLLISGLNTSEKELKDLFGWLSDIDNEIPLHLSRYFPNYKMDRPPTKLSDMESAYRLAKKYLDYVYLGNIKSSKKNNTYCPQCGKLLIRRNIFNSKNKITHKGKCPSCGKKIYGIF